MWPTAAGAKFAVSIQEKLYWIITSNEDYRRCVR